jgi:hypothetical protein
MASTEVPGDSTDSFRDEGKSLLFRLFGLFLSVDSVMVRDTVLCRIRSAANASVVRFDSSPVQY